MKLYLKIYELKGIVESLSELANHDEEYNNPIIEKIESKMEQIVEEIEKISA